MFHIFFKRTMDDLGVSGIELAKAHGCSRKYLSEIRQGKCSPPINSFYELLETMEKLRPGAKLYFADLIAERAVSFSQLIESMDNEQLSEILFKVSQALKQKRESHAKKVEQFLTAS